MLSVLFCVPFYGMNKLFCKKSIMNNGCIVIHDIKMCFGNTLKIIFKILTVDSLAQVMINHAAFTLVRFKL